MYPTIHNFDANPLHAYPAVGSNTGGSAGGSAGGASAPAAPAPPRANGPPPPPPAAFPTLQVTIDPRFQVAPPVSIACCQAMVDRWRSFLLALGATTHHPSRPPFCIYKQISRACCAVHAGAGAIPAPGGGRRFAARRSASAAARSPSARSQRRAPGSQFGATAGGRACQRQQRQCGYKRCRARRRCRSSCGGAGARGM